MKTTDEQQRAAHTLHYTVYILATELLSRLAAIAPDDLDIREVMKLQDAASDLVAERTEALRKHLILYPD